MFKVVGGTWKIAKNPNYFKSVKLGLYISVWMLASSFAKSIKAPLIGVIASLGSLIITLFMIAYAHVFVFGAGLCGYVVSTTDENNQQTS